MITSAHFGRNDKVDMYIQIITTIIVLFLISRVGTRFKKKEINFKEAVAWGVLWFAVGIVVLYPNLADDIASRVGLQTATGIDLVVYIAVGVVFYLVFRILVRIERIERDITKVIRHVALKDEDDK
jgi:small membrane protein